jgi:hypothetical protein
MKPDALLWGTFASVWPMLDERTRCLMAASEALVLPYGGVLQSRGQLDVFIS